MAEDSGSRRTDSFAEASEIEITIVPDPGARPLRERLARFRVPGGRRAAVGISLIAAVALAVLGVVTSSVEHLGLRSVEASARSRGVVGVATAYGQRLHCLKVTFATDDPSYARADFDHRSACGQYDGDATAVFHRVGGSWRPVLDAVTYACPVASLPARVQIDLAVCPLPAK